MSHTSQTIFIYSNPFSELYYCYDNNSYEYIKHDYETPGDYNKDLITGETMPSLSFFSIYSGQHNDIIPLFRFRDIYVFINKDNNIERIDCKHVTESYIISNTEVLRNI